MENSSDNQTCPKNSSDNQTCPKNSSDNQTCPKNDLLEHNNIFSFTPEQMAKYNSTMFSFFITADDIVILK